jgi:hypothetical protein
MSKLLHLQERFMPDFRMQTINVILACHKMAGRGQMVYTPTCMHSSWNVDVLHTMMCTCLTSTFCMDIFRSFRCIQMEFHRFLQFLFSFCMLGNAETHHKIRTPCSLRDFGKQRHKYCRVDTHWCDIIFQLSGKCV